MSTTETTEKTAPDMEAVRAFELEPGESVMLACPGCGDLFRVHPGEDANTLGDIIDGLAMHKCRGYDLYGSDEEPTP